MFSFGWGEILLIVVVVVIVVGPKDIPKFLRQIAKLSKSIKKVKCKICGFEKIEV